SRQCRPARLQQAFLHSGEICTRLPENDVGRNHCAGDRTLPCPYPRNLHGRMTVQNRFDFLGIHLLPTDIDNTLAAPEEMVAVATPLYQVAGINEARAIAEAARGAAQIT